MGCDAPENSQGVCLGRVKLGSGIYAWGGLKVWVCGLLGTRRRCAEEERGSKALRLRGLHPTRLHPSVRGEEWRFS